VKRRPLFGAPLVLVTAMTARAEVPARTVAPAAKVRPDALSSAPSDTSNAPASKPDVQALADSVAADRKAIAELARELAAERARAREGVHFSGYAQVDWIAYDQASQNELDHSTGLPINQERFTLRRGHLRAEAQHGSLSGALELDANTTNGPQVRPIDAEISYRWPREGDPELPSIGVTAGLMKIPFGFEVPELDSVRPFLERATVLRALFPGEFDLGARVRVDYRMLDLTVAVMNGNPLGDRAFPALAPARAKELVGRLGTTAVLTPAVTLDLGVSADGGTGFHEGTPTTKDQVVWRDENGDGIVQATEIQVIGGSSATPSELFRRFALGGDLRLTVRFAPFATLTIRSELARAQNLDRGIHVADPVGRGYDLRELGWYVGATQEITRWVLVGARYDRYDPDADASEQRALHVVPADQSYRTLALLAMLRYDGARLSAEYDKNWNALGRDANGDPTNLKSDTFTMRAQVSF
jgi:hypothetical protein